MTEKKTATDFVIYLREEDIAIQRRGSHLCFAGMNDVLKGSGDARQQTERIPACRMASMAVCVRFTMRLG